MYFKDKRYYTKKVRDCAIGLLCTIAFDAMVVFTILA